MDGEATAEAVEERLRSLLRAHPDATVFFIDPSSLSPPPPEHPGLEGLGPMPSEVLGPLEALERLEPESRAVALTAIDRIAGVGVVHDRLRSAAGGPVDSYLFDTFERRALYVGLQVDAAGQSPGPAYAEPTEDLVPRRVLRYLTDGLGRVVGGDGGTPGEPAPERLMLDALHPDDVNELRVGWASMLASPGVTHRFRLRVAAGDEWRWFEMAAVAERRDEQSVVSLEMVDITTEMEAHEEVRRRERTLHRLAESLPQAIVQLDRDGTMVYANARAVDLLGSHLDGLGPLVDASEPTDGGHLAVALNSALRGQDHDLELRLVHPTARVPMVVEVVLRALTDDTRADGVMCAITDITERSLARRQLEHQATFDQLTGVHNRGSVMRGLELALAERAGSGVAVIFIDLDHFKEVNDRFGHQAGDQVLRAVAERISGVTRGRDLVGRLGGDEFVVVCPAVDDPTAARAAAERVAAGLGGDGGSDALRGVRASIGVAWSGGDRSADVLLRRADAAMYQAKRTGSRHPVLDPGPE